MHLGPAIEDFLLYLEDQGKSAMTIAAYRSDLRHFTKFLTENQASTELAEIKPVRIRDFLRYCRRQGLATSSTCRRLNCLRSFFNFSLKQEWPDKDPTTPVDAPKIPETLPVYMDNEEVERVLASVNGARHFFARRDRSLIKLMLTTGIRRSELINLNWQDVNFKEKRLIVRQGKGKKDRLIPLRDEVLNDLWDYLQTRLPLHNDAMFLSREHNRLCKGSLARTVYRYVRAAGIKGKKVTAHVFRHTFATHLIHQGVDVATLKDLMGHADIGTTMKYAHSNDSHRISAVQCISFPGLSNCSWNMTFANTWEEPGKTKNRSKEAGTSAD